MNIGRGLIKNVCVERHVVGMWKGQRRHLVEVIYGPVYHNLNF